MDEERTIFVPMQLTRLFQDLFNSEKAGGMLLVLCATISLVITNTALGEGYAHFWHADVGGRPLEFWINDGLMSIFFLLIGLELERELYAGELSQGRQALLPALAAVGGMLVPAGIYAFFNFGTLTASGAGIPMATDIAFAIGVLALLGDRVPVALKVFLTALAVMDDLGAILTIAIFYSNGIQWAFLGAAMGLFAFMVLLNRLKVHRLWPYLFIGPVMWYCMLESGVHATIAGVLLAFAIPFGSGDERSPSYRLQHLLHRPVAFGIMPLFALANTCIALAPGWLPGLLSPDSLGIFFGLVVGKPLGIALFTGASIALGWCALPEGTRFTQLIGVGCLAGIGFTMSIFITLLAFDDPAIVVNAKTAILASSLVAAVVGAVWIRRTLAR